MRFRAPQDVTRVGTGPDVENPLQDTMEYPGGNPLKRSWESASAYPPRSYPEAFVAIVRSKLWPGSRDIGMASAVVPLSNVQNALTRNVAAVTPALVIENSAIPPEQSVNLRAPIRMTHSSRTAKSQQIRMQARERNA